MKARTMMAAVAISATVSAWAETKKIGDYTWTYRIVNGAAEIWNDDATAISPEPTGTVTIPATLGGYSVRSIGGRAFKDCDGMTAVSIPSSVANIGSFAFWRCSGIAAVTIPSSVTDIGSDAFRACSSLASVTIPGSVTNIGAGAFEECSSLASVTIPASVKMVNVCAFKDCTSLKTVTYLGNRPAIGIGLYAGTPADLVTVVPVAATGWDEALEAGTWLDRAICRAGSSVWMDPDGYLWTYRIVGDGAEIFRADSSGYGVAAIRPTPTDAVTIPATLGGKPVTSIGEGAFFGCDGVTDVTIPDSVTGIGVGAFYGCGGLKGVALPDGLACIGESAFDRCSLTNVTIPASVAEIGYYAFQDCASLKTVTYLGECPVVCPGVYNNTPSDLVSVVPADDSTWSDALAAGTWQGRAIRSAAPVKCTVRFDANGGSVTPTSRTVNSGAAVGSLPTPTRGGFTFKGWFTAKTGGMQITSSTPANADVTYYAQWTPKQYKLSYGANGGTVSPAYKMVNYCATYGTLPTPTWGGHDFKGWFTAKTGGTKVTSSTKCTGNATIYAQWTIKQYRLSFDANGGTVSPTYKMVNYCATCDSFPTPTWGGHTFNGWFTARSGGTKVTAPWKCTGNKTVYAQWTVKQYKLTYNANGGTVSPAYVMVDYCKTCDSFPTPTWGGHTFQGWFTARSGGTKVTAPWKCTGNKTIYAQWTAKQYTITFNANGGTVSPASKKVDYCATYTLPTPTWSGHTFNGWYTAKTGGTKVTSPAKCTGNATLYARW